MVSKILKTELLGLFVITLLSFVSFYYRESLPDNYLLISSKSVTNNFLLYYFSSFMAMVGFFSGPWIFFPFFFFSLFYTFLYSKRDFFFDAANIVSLTGLFLAISFCFSPLLLGEGLLFILNQYLSRTIMLLLLPLFLIGFLAGTYRKKFKNFVLNFYGNFSRSLNEIVSKKRITFSPKEGSKSWWKNSKEKISTLFKFKRNEPALERKEKFKFLPSRMFKSKDKNPFIAKTENEEIENKTEPEKVADQLLLNVEEPTVRIKEKTSLRKDQQNYFDLVKTIRLKQQKESIKVPGDEYFETIIDRIESKLKEFKIEGLIINVLKGPVVDTYELELGPGVKVSKITNHSQDLSLALYGAPIRIVYPMRGRTTMGIEVPRSPREIIYLDEVLSAREFTESEAHLPLSIGRDAFGEVFVVDLSNMPHMLVAGATGAGKSVFINTILSSLLVKKSPNKLKLILIDPKQLELVLYAKLPHLVMPVVTEAKIASLALLWACQEMERRYSILKEMGVRNIDGFNKKVRDASPELISKIHHFYEEEDCDRMGYELPYLVIVVDEFADLILTKAGKEIENNICRLAAKARAAGIHLIIATQRPSVDVITGLIKSNFPTRVSFRVTTSIDSRTILNSMGAELLLGKGDMLYKAGVETMRVHSAYVDEKAVENLTKTLSQYGGEFHNGAMEFLENGGDDSRDAYSFGSHIPNNSVTDQGNDDALFKDAVRIVMEHRSASASMLQRRMRIGYNRAANLIEEMEQKGIVGEAQGSKPRKVLSCPENL